MCRKWSYCLCSSILLLSLMLGSVAQAALPGLIGWWKFDGNLLDSSGLHNDGTAGGSPTFVAGKIGTALELAGSDYVVIDAVADDVTDNDITMCLWLKTTDNDAEVIACNTAGRGNVVRLAIDSSKAAVDIGSPAGHSTTSVDDGQWHHVAYIRSGSSGDIYIDGIQESTSPAGFNFSATDLWSIGQEWDSGGPSGFLSGTVDDVQIYDRALTQKEIAQVMVGVPPGAASNPIPANEATDVYRDTDLSWTPGEFAAAVNGHRVFLGESFTDVNEGIGGVAQSAAVYDPGRLNLGTTYFWRIDEVNAPPDSTVYKGEVWSFTTEPVGYPIENITVTASSSGQDNLGPENTIDGSGLDENDGHSTEPTDMWLSGDEPQGAWIQYEFDNVYKLHSMLVWNSNQVFEPLFGFGMKDVTIEYSTNGTDWAALADVPQFGRASGMPGYAQNTTVDFGGAGAKFVKLTATSNWGGMLPQYGLSEVRFLYTPVSARNPSPGSGAVDVAVDGTMSWRPGRETATHNVYLSTDQQAVIDGTVSAVSTTDASYSSDLILASTYYWRVDEVNDAETPPSWQGDVWDFVTQEFIVVDDFEDYNDYPPNEIYTTWVDGYEIPTNGSQVGNLSPPLAETTIVHSGKQSMPIFYSNNGGATYSEGERIFAAAQNWTKHGVTALVLYFYGTAGNTGQMYVKINGTKIPYDGAAGNIALAAWQTWSIDLAASGLNLQSVTRLAIGIDGNGAAGTLYVDDIGLHPAVLAPPNEWRVSASSDDAEEHVLDGGAMESLTSSDLELGYEGAMAPAALQTIGCRWVGIPIPKGATITEAWVQFSADDINNDYHIPDVSLIIAGELSPSPATFSSTAGDITSRPTTMAQVVWDVPQWMTTHAMGPEERTPDISSIIQEIVNQPGWAGEAIVLTFRDNPAKPSQGTREAEAFDGEPSEAPLLHISHQ